MTLRALMVVVLAFAATNSVATEPERVAVVIFQTGDEAKTILDPLVFQLKENVRKSTRFTTATSVTDSMLCIHMTSLPIDEQVRSIAVAVVWVTCAPGAPGVTRLTENFLASAIHIINAQRTDEAANGLMAMTDTVLDQRNAWVDEYFASLMAGMCKPPIKAGSEELCASIKKSADKPR